MKPITQELVNKIRELISHGLVRGLGKPQPGEMCIEACICYALEEPHSDKPSCVPEWLANIKIELNDAPNWKSSQERAEVLKDLAIAQLGSLHIDEDKFLASLWLETHKKILPKIIQKEDNLYNLPYIEKFSKINSLEEFDLLWEEFYNNYNYNYYNYQNYNNYNNYYNHNNYNYFSYYYDEGLYQDVANILVQLLKDFKSEGSKFLN